MVRTYSFGASVPLDRSLPSTIGDDRAQPIVPGFSTPQWLRPAFRARREHGNRRTTPWYWPARCFILMPDCDAKLLLIRGTIAHESPASGCWLKGDRQQPEDSP